MELHLHYTKYHDFNNDMVDIFFYNHKYKLEDKDNYLMIPTIIPRVLYFKQVENKILFEETLLMKNLFLLSTPVF